MIRPITDDDTSALVALADATGLFSPDQLEELRAMVSAALASTGETRPFWLADDDGGLKALAYCEPERMTDGTWNLQLIAVHPTCQRQGRGTQILCALEQTLAGRGARVLLVDTLGTLEFEHVRAFYRRNGFEEEACIREFYARAQTKSRSARH
jgi:ribosomal protein S18 acetylase RimI-like enzyme